jgi:hypothetical protein
MEVNGFTFLCQFMSWFWDMLEFMFLFVPCPSLAQDGEARPNGKDKSWPQIPSSFGSDSRKYALLLNF